MTETKMQGSAKRSKINMEKLNQILEDMELPGPDSPKLPSHHQLGDYVHLVVSKEPNSVLWSGKVIKVHFSPSKVMYDLEFTVSIDNENKKRYTTRIHNVDGALVCSVEEYEAAAVFDVVYGAENIPKKHTDFSSVEVLIDLNGNKKDYRVGWYDFDEKGWKFHVSDTSALDLKYMKWTYIN
jgi:hypothetical protein